MEELNQKLDKDTFNRFKLIQHLIKKYPIIKYDISRIEQIKNSYIEYNPKYSTIDGKIKFTDSEFLSKHVLNQLETLRFKLKSYLRSRHDYKPIRSSTKICI